MYRSSAENLRRAKRVLILGPCGAGKSTLAQSLAPLLSLPLIHLDAEYWQPKWVEPSKDEWAAKVSALIQSEEWLIDGNYGGTMAQRVTMADAIVYLDLSTDACLWRVVRRVIRHHGRVRPDMGDGCPEKFDWEFMKFVASYRRNHHAKHMAMLDREARAGKTVVVLRSQEDIDAFLKEVANRARA